MEVRRRWIPYWLLRSDESLQKNTMTILDRCNAIRRLLCNTNESGDQADLEGARIDLRDTLAEIFKEGNTEVNPLWAAVMVIRPQVINGRLPVSVTEELANALYNLKNAESPDSLEAAFFGKLAARLRRHQVNFFMATIAGQPLVAKENTGAWKTHYFPGIPFSIRKEAGVRLSTHPDNVPSVIKAYELMAAQTAGHAKTAIEAIIADIEGLSVNLYPQPRR